MLEQNNALPVLKTCIEVNYPEAFKKICTISGFNLNAIFPDVILEFVKLKSGIQLNDTWTSHLSEQNVNCQDPVTGKTPLICAVEKVDIELVKWLLTYKNIDLNSKDKNSNTALNIADKNKGKYSEEISLYNINSAIIYSLLKAAIQKRE
ncbi:ankyrin repeat domain-containing protein [Candidatus Dependentiae bacterium]|nr:MAG: ankyrin repeat domain-containing protein [Candidatus Dependentiae bacterium]